MYRWQIHPVQHLLKLMLTSVLIVFLILFDQENSQKRDAICAPLGR